MPEGFNPSCCKRGSLLPRKKEIQEKSRNLLGAKNTPTTEGPSRGTGGAYRKNLCWKKIPWNNKGGGNIRLKGF